MAFSFRVGTNWCHDFPKLARESGFYFNMHRNRVRVDWNRICSIDVDRVIRERDFSTVDENVNNVIDYFLESEYDVKILDPNFVKLFRLAQLAVEYLLYCKQYLDQSVIILKEELKSKIEENIKLKKDINIVEDQVESLKGKLKDRDKMLETRNGDSHGEIHKCPHCTKTFISAMFVRAHISRRHPLSSEALSISSPVHEKYRTENEKLHNEIKTLKERLNQTERVIRNESNKASQNISLSNDLRASEYDSFKPRNDSNQDLRMEEQHKKYQEEISSLKIMLLSELRNLKQSSFKEIGLSGLHNTEIMNEKELIRHQENENQKLQNPIPNNVTSDLECIQDKLLKQEEYWKIKLEHLESQHSADIENLFTQLKLTQEAANRMKWEYETKVNDLEKKSISQSKILTAQNERLNRISLDIQDIHSQDHSDSESSSISKFSKEKNSKNNKIQTNSRKIQIVSKEISEKSKNSKKNDLLFEDLDSISSHESKKTFCPENIIDHSHWKTLEKKKSKIKSPKRTIKSSENGFITAQNPNSNFEVLTNGKNLDRNSFFDDYSEDTVNPFQSSYGDENIQYKSINKNYMDKLHSQTMKNEPTTKLIVRENEKLRRKKNCQDNSEEKDCKLIMQPSPSESEESELTSEAESETETSVTESEEGSLSESFDENPTINQVKSPMSNKFNQNTISENPLLLNEVKNRVNNDFENGLRKLSIDPEWSGIPKATYEATLEILKHQKKINSKKFMNYDQIRKKLLADIPEKLSMKQKQPHKYESVKKSLLNKMMSNVKSRAMKALNIQKSHGAESVSRSRDSTPRTSHSKQKFGLDLLPKKLSELEIRELKRENRNRQISTKKSESQIDSSPTSTPRRSSIHLDRIINSRIQNSKELTNLTLSGKKISQSHENIKEMKALDMTSVKVTSTPNKNINNIMQDSYSIATNEPEIINSFPMSPKNNKSVLKTTSGSVGSLIKKKVLFDLKNSPEKNSMQIRSLGEILSDYDSEKRELNDSDWNISRLKALSISDEKDQTFGKEKSKSMDNIVLKTSQSDKIAQISKKIEEQLSIARRRPTGSIEAMFLAKSHQKSSDKEKTISVNNLLLKSPERTFESKYNTDNRVPQAAPRSNTRNKEFNASNSSNKLPDTKESDLDLDINEILEIK